MKKLGYVNNYSLRPATCSLDPEILTNAITISDNKDLIRSREQVAGRRDMKCQHTLLFIFFILISTNIFAAINTQYPGCSPNDATAAELSTEPLKYYPAQIPLNKQAIEANDALRKQR